MPSDFSWAIELAHLGGLGRAERRGGLVHDQDPGVEVDGPGDRHRLALTARQRLHRRLEVLEPRVEPAASPCASPTPSPSRRASRSGSAARARGTRCRRRRCCRPAPASGRWSRSRAPWRRAGCGSSTGSPLMRISPESAGWAPDRVCISVDLPAPLPPTRPTTSPGVEVDGDAVDGVDAAERHADVAHLDERDAGAARRRVRSSCASARPTGLDDDRQRVRRDASLTLDRRRPERRVDGDGRDEHDADHDVLRRRVDLEQHHARAQRLHDDRAEHGAGDRADAAGERRAADDRGGDDVELVLHAEAGDRGVEPGRLDRGADRAQDAHQDEREHDRAAGVDAAQLGRLGVAADGVDVAAEAAAAWRGRSSRASTPIRMTTGYAMPVGIFRPPAVGDAVRSAYWLASSAATGSCWRPDRGERRRRSRARRAPMSTHIGRTAKP